jgi:hypothetical protein
MAKPAVDRHRVRVEFFQLAFQYYVAARFAASAHLLPVTGNLFHHAIEMFLKGELTKHLDEPERRRIGHRLTKLWAAFKQQMPAGQSLASFDLIIDELDKFEDIRFPENIVSRGMTCSIGFGKPLIASARTGSRPEPRYELSVPDIDRLVKTILDASEVNPLFFTAGYHGPARTYLRRMNRSKKTRLW